MISTNNTALSQTEENLLVDELLNLSLANSTKAKYGKLEMGRSISQQGSAQLETTSLNASSMFKKISHQQAEELFRIAYQTDTATFVHVRGESHLCSITRLKIERFFKQKSLEVTPSFQEFESIMHNSFKNAADRIDQNWLDKKACGYDSLVWSIEKGLSEIAIAIVSRCNELDKINANGETPLIMAIKRGQATLALELLARMSDETLGLQDFSGNTALHWAIKKGHAKVAHQLIVKKAGIDTLDRQRHSPLFLARQRGLRGVALALVKLKVPNGLPHAFIHTLMIWATQKEEVDTALALAKKRSSYKVPEKYAIQLIRWALDRNEMTLAGSLVEAIHKIRDEAACLVLFDTISKHPPEISLQLVAKMPVHLLEKPDQYGLAPVFHSIFSGKTSVTLAIIDRVSLKSLETRDTAGNSLLMKAIKRGQTAVPLALIDKGVDLERANSNGETPLSLANEQGDVDVFMALRQQIGAKQEQKANSRG